MQNKEIKRKLTAGMALIMALSMLCSCSVKTKRQLIDYANDTYGKCKVIKVHSNWKGKDAITSIKVKDNDTGIEYELTSTLEPISIDGSTFGYAEQTSSDFEQQYYEYLLDLAKSDIKKIERKYNMSYSFEYNIFILTFNDRESGENARECAVEFDEALEEYDVKLMRPREYIFYVDNVLIGSYDSEYDDSHATRNFDIIDYVHQNYDPKAKYTTCMSCYLNQFLSYDEIDRLLPDHDGTPSGTCYYFLDKDGDRFVAIYLDDFGIKGGGVRLYRDKASGMEEIEF